MKTNTRYRFYREHKFITQKLAELDALIAKTDFRVLPNVETIKENLADLTEMLMGHAFFENSCIHPLLKSKNSNFYEKIEMEHQHHEKDLNSFREQLESILDSTAPVTRENAGYTFYLNFRLFFSENLKHLHEEETIVMAELQRLYSDDELRLIEFNTFKQMSPEDMTHMIDALTPYINPSDRAFFLNEMNTAEPKKFIESGLTLSEDNNLTNA